MSKPSRSSDRRARERRDKVKTAWKTEGVARADSTPHKCYDCGQTVLGPPQDYICPERKARH